MGSGLGEGMSPPPVVTCEALNFFAIKHTADVRNESKEFFTFSMARVLNELRHFNLL
jgi:hypothetical protein